jgi:hypothetical protein
MKRGARIWEMPLEILDGVLGFGSNLAALGSRCWAFIFGHVKHSFPFLGTGFRHFSLTLEYPVFFVNAIKIYVSQIFSLLQKAV